MPGAATCPARPRGRPSSGTEPPHLTPRQRQCLRLAALGLTNGEIAVRLGLADATVDTYFYTAYERLGVQTGTKLSTRVDAFRRLGWLQVPAS